MYVETLLIKHYYMMMMMTAAAAAAAAAAAVVVMMILHAPPPLSLPFPCPALRELTCDSCGSVSSQVVHVEDGVFSWDKADKPTLSKYVLDSFHPQLELN